jgi:hypothetical protein
MRYFLDGQRSVDRLSPGHGNGIVKQDLECDVGACSNRLPDGKRSRMIEGAVAEVLENVFAAIEH